MKTIFTLLFIALLAAPTFGQNTQTPCSSPEHRQFDFWIGQWEVYHATADTLVGRSHIKNILGSCVIEENWQSANGAFKGKSFNTYNAVNKTWNQTWVDNSGATYHFSGTFENNVMAMTGESTGADGNKSIFKMSFTPNQEDGTIRQVWKMSQDGGETFALLFDGIYKK